MLRSDPVQPGHISKHALRSMQGILAQPLRSTHRPDGNQQIAVPEYERPA